MLRKFVCAAVITVVGLSVAMAEEFVGVITKVEGDKVTFKKGGGFGKKKDPDAPPAKEMTLPVTKDAKIMKGKFNKDEGKVAATDPIEGGLKNEMFSKAKIEESKFGGVFATITTDADNKNITAITVGGGFGGKGGKKKDAN